MIQSCDFFQGFAFRELCHIHNSHTYTINEESHPAKTGCLKRHCSNLYELRHCSNLYVLCEQIKFCDSLEYKLKQLLVTQKDYFIFCLL